MPEHPAPPVLAPLLDVRQRLQQGFDAWGHTHAARGLRVETVAAGTERTHAHRTPVGTTDAAPNRSGHQHRLPTGQWTAPSTARWSSASVGRREGAAMPGPLACPQCGARLSHEPGAAALPWRCAAGHRYPTTRGLIAALRASGWVPDSETHPARREA